MDPCARQVCHIVQFLAASAEEQIAFAGDLLPATSARAVDGGALVTNDDRRYDSYWSERGVHPLYLLGEQLEEYLPIFSGLEENTLPPDETVLDELVCVLAMMVFFRSNRAVPAHFWVPDSLREMREWRVVRRLSRIALARLGWAQVLPAASFEDLLYG
jgi:hypothetical protein